MTLIFLEHMQVIDESAMHGIRIEKGAGKANDFIPMHGFDDQLLFIGFFKPGPPYIQPLVLHFMIQILIGIYATVMALPA